MNRRADEPRSRADFQAATGVLLVQREVPLPASAPPGQPTAVPADPAEGPEILLAVWDDGSVTGLHGHVDLGTGLRTALTQIVAEELDVGIERVAMVMGDTAAAPNQGATIASASLQVHAAPLRSAAAQAREWLRAEAAGRPGAEGAAPLAALIAGRRVVLTLSHAAPLKSPADYRIVGTSTPRVDIPAKATGVETFVHDKRLPGMLHGRVVRPPYAGVDAGDFVGNTLEAVDEASIGHIPGIRAVVVIRDFVGIVAEREEAAEAAMQQLQVRWKPWPGLPPLGDLQQALKANPSTRRLLLERGDVDAALADAAQPMPRTYLWPYQLHASIGPSCAVADWRGEGTGDKTAGGDGSAGDGSGSEKMGGGGAARLTVWAGTQNPHVLRADLALLTSLADIEVEVVRMEAAGCYGRNGADDVAADAALLSRAVGAPVRVQLSREQENLWEPKGAAQLMQVDGGLTADGQVAGYDFQTSYPSNGAPTLALLLTGTIAATATAYEMGDRTAVPPYAYRNLRVVAHDMAPILRASWLRGVSALPNAFAHESYIDELASAAGADPVDFRLRQLADDPRAAELIRATAARAGWRVRTGPQQGLGVGSGSGTRAGSDGGRLKGQGFAYARYFHSRFPGFGAAWAAWVADVEVDPASGEVHVERIVVGHDAGLMINPAGVQHQIHGNLLQTTSRALKESLPLDRRTSLPASREWGSYPILDFREVPVVEVLMMPRPGEPALGAGESASVPGTAAIANAIFDATGVRFRAPPFIPEVVRAALNPLPPPAAEGAAAGPGSAPSAGGAGSAAASLTWASAADTTPASRAAAAAADRAPWPRRRRGLWARGGALAAALTGIALAAIGWRPTIAPVAAGASAAGVYSEATVARGRELAATGDCVVCHTAPGGRPNAGGRALETPFGTVYSSNLTPDAATGIGSWSFSAFQRAMRLGIARDGHHLYPAFPYTAFSRTTDDDLTALYAYLMAQPAVSAAVPTTRLAFPFNLRPLLGLWNALYLEPGPVAATEPNPARSAQWQRGAYLVDGLGHCGGCHTPRNALGAERSGRAYLAGAMIDGWEAPALTSLSAAPLPWTEAELFGYLRNGHSAHHGQAGGPMAPVVQQLQQVADPDIRAMAHYLASFNSSAVDAPAGTSAPQAEAMLRRSAATAEPPGPASRLFDSACGACHHAGDGPAVFGQNIPLAFSTKLHSDRPENLLRTLLEGIREPATPQVGHMPAFRDAFDDGQIVLLATHLRRRFAPDKPPWLDLQATTARLRSSPTPPH